MSRHGYQLLGMIALSAALTAPVIAGQGVTTSNVKLRQGPDTNKPIIDTIPQGSKVDVSSCDPSGAWCAVTWQGKNGFVSGQQIKDADTKNAGWPRTYTTSQGAQVVLYQPQVTAWKNFSQLNAQIATEIRKTKNAEPIFGVINITGKTAVNKSAGVVMVSDVAIEGLNFSALDRTALTALSLEIGKLLPTGPITLPEQQLIASIANTERLTNVQDLKSEPPVIFVSKQASILVQTDGKAMISPIKGVEGLSFVVNTNWDILINDADKRFFLRDDKSWFATDDLAQGWQPVMKLPEFFSKLPDDDNWKDARAALNPVAMQDGTIPRIFYSDTPAELIQFTGEPKLEQVPGTGLEWASNSENDVFFRKADNHWYILLSGRWFSSTSLDGPWVFATPTLPEDFRNIPEGTPYYTVRASVPGTSESAEARLRASIPQTARVAIDGSVKVEVTYSGNPKFEPVAKGSSVSYAVNTNEQVILYENKYYVLKEGIWFVGDHANGPFVVARYVPEAIYKIPPSSPVYNVTYVRIYDTTDKATVMFGYTMGYLGGYLAWGSVVYGTGWYYPPYWDYGWVGGYKPYYPYPGTYGMGAYYNPVNGTYGRYGYAYGPYRGIAGGAAYNPSTGTYIRGGAVQGPYNGRGFVSAYNPRTNTSAYAHGGYNVYGSWGTASVQQGSNWAVAHGANVNGGGEGVSWRTSSGNHGFVAGGGRTDDVYAGRDGNVYRHHDGQWEKRSDGEWSPVQKPSSQNLRQSGQSLNSKNPDTTTKARDNRPVQDGTGSARNNSARQPQRANQQNAPAAPDHLTSDLTGRQVSDQHALGQRMESRPDLQSGARFHGEGLAGSGFEGGGGRRGGFAGGSGFHRR